MPSFLTLWAYLQNLQTRASDREDGLVAIEYVVLGALVVAIIGAATIIFRTDLIAKFDALL